MPNVSVYIDGFNFYYGSLKGTPYKWIDPNQLCRQTLHENDIVTKIRYFTARVSARPDDPKKPLRQQLYLRALLTIPNLEIHYGKYLTNIVRMPLAKPVNGYMGTVEVMKTDEKGSDVNLASYLLLDATQKHMDSAIVISNDSDLVTPIQLLRSHFNIPVGILNPNNRNPSSALQRAGNFFKTIREPVLQSSQFPAILKDSKGTFYKPKEW